MFKNLSKKLLFFCILLCCLLFASASLAALTGDVNGSNIVDIIDALMVAQYTIGLNPAGFIAANADVNSDGSINVVDALMIAQYSVGIITSFPLSSTPTSVVTRTFTPVPSRTATIYGTPAPTSLPGSTPIPGGTSGPTSGPTSTSTPDPSINYFYFSYDDSASTAAVELVKYQINNGQQVASNLARPWEFLNFEEFSPAATENTGLFDISMGIWKRPALEAGFADEYKLGVYLASPVIEKETRKNVVITLVVDISGSMATTTTRVDNVTTTRMDIVKYGLGRMVESLKAGDVINVITFDTTARIVAQGLTYENNLADYMAIVDALAPTGTTNLADGVDKGYQAAFATFDPAKTNRIVMLTDAFANTGVIDTSIISNNIVINNMEGIYFSGLGISLNFNEAFLNEIVEAGKGAYFTLATKNDAARAFTDRFCALLTVAAKDVQFRLDYPMGLIHDESASEQSSTDPADVQPTNFSYNTSQYFFEGFKTEQSSDFTSETFKLTIMYKNPDDGTPVTEVYEKPVSALLDVDNNLLRDAETIFLLTQLIGKQQGVAAVNQVLNTYYTNYTSPLFDEYLGLILKYSQTIAGKFEVAPTSINYHIIPLGQQVTRVLTLINNTDSAVTVTNMKFLNTGSLPVTGSFTHNAVLPAYLAPLQAAYVNVTFNPGTVGNYYAKLQIFINDSESPVVAVPLSGTAAITEPPLPTPLP